MSCDVSVSTILVLFSSVTLVSPQQGVIVAGGEEYLIEPLVSPDNQTRTEKGERAEGRPHVVYKRSSLRHQYKGQSCGVIGERRDILVLLEQFQIGGGTEIFSQQKKRVVV